LLRAIISNAFIYLNLIYEQPIVWNLQSQCIQNCEMGPGREK